MAKTNQSIYSGQTSSVDLATATAYDLDDADAADLYLEIVQVGTASTVASVEIHLSPDDTEYYRLTTWAADSAAATYQGVVTLGETAKAVKVVYTAQSGGTSSTLKAELSKTAY